jgi:hypothetical protein
VKVWREGGESTVKVWREGDESTVKVWREGDESTMKVKREGEEGKIWRGNRKDLERAKERFGEGKRDSIFTSE